MALGRTGIWHRIERGLAFAGRVPGYIVGLVTLAIGVDVITRNLGLGTIDWILETVEYLLYLLTFLGVPYVMLRGGHVTVDIVTNSLPPGPRAVVVAVGAALVTVVSAFLLWVTAIATIQAFEDNSTIYKTIVIKEWVLLALLPVSFAALTLVCARLFWLSLKPSDGEAPARDGPRL